MRALALAFAMCFDSSTFVFHGFYLGLCWVAMRRQHVSMLLKICEVAFVCFHHPVCVCVCA